MPHRNKTITVGTDPGQAIFATPREALLHYVLSLSHRGWLFAVNDAGKKASSKKGSNTPSSAVDKADLVKASKEGKSRQICFT